MSAGRVVLVAVDASDNARFALNYYLQELHKPTDQIVICHIPELPDLPSFSFKAGIQLPVEEWTKALQDQNLRVRQIEETYEQILTPKKVQFKMHSAANKSPGQGIMQVIEAEAVNLVIVGTRGLDKFRRTLLGSVSDYVVRHSKVPVLVCPSPSQ